MVERGETPVPQPDTEASYYPRRTPADSEPDPGKSISEQSTRSGYAIRTVTRRSSDCTATYSISLKRFNDDKH